MRFVCTLFAIIFALLSLVEIFGGNFWLYRVLNVVGLVCLCVACRRQPIVVPLDFEELDEDERDEDEDELDNPEAPLPSV